MFCHDHWYGEVSLKNRFPRLFYLMVHKDAWVADFGMGTTSNRDLEKTF